MKYKKQQLWLAASLPLQILFISWLKSYPEWIERYYSTGIYPYISSFFRITLGWIPFSVGDLLLIVFFFLGIRSLYLFFKKFRKKGFSLLIQLFSFISVLYFCFYVFWGLNYFRTPLVNSLNLKNQTYSTEQLISLAEVLVQKTNDQQLLITQDTLESVIVPYKPKELYFKATQSYNELSKTYPQFSYHHPSVKSSLISVLQSYNGTAGYLNPLTGEAQVNYKIPKTSFPATTCHEIAHQIGFSAENEANFIGFLAAIHSKDKYFQYSGYKMALRYTLVEIYKRDKIVYKTVLEKINGGVLKDFHKTKDFWNQYENPIEPILKKGYDTYLKANNQKSGTKTYNYVVDLLISYYLNNPSR